MATQTIKTTYSLDVETVRKLEIMARRWNVSKSEALRRAIRAAAQQALTNEGRDTLKALDRLQRSLNLDAEAADQWKKATRSERQASSRRRKTL
ncbi:MAG: ribbon-helix-helix protein, CopG family [Gammaproteobacteria bacterium]|nr:ribbon-helix-helix protein, CopG family [Gammaproteobacteria bacterium]